jgi:hypothetical protein
LGSALRGAERGEVAFGTGTSCGRLLTGLLGTGGDLVAQALPGRGLGRSVDRGGVVAVGLDPVGGGPPGA